MLMVRRSAVGVGAEPRHGGGLEVDDLRLVDFVDDTAGRPWQPVQPGVQAGSQDHCLTGPLNGRADEEFVEEPGAHRQGVGFVLQFGFAALPGVR